MLKELDCVVLLNDFEELPKWTKGTIVFDFENDDTYLVEFFDDNHNTIKTTLVSRNNIEKIKNNL